MDLNEAITHAREVAEGCSAENRDCAYQHDKLADWLEELKQYRTLGPIDRLRELVQEDRLIGQTVYEPNKRGFVSTYKVISIHISECSVLVGWELLDGIYSNLNGFEISALSKTVFLTREEAEATLEGMKNG